MLWSRLSPPKTLPNNLKVSETGRKMIDTTSMKPTARKITPKKAKMSELTSDFSALLPNQSLMMALMPANLKRDVTQARILENGSLSLELSSKQK